ncbi:helix-turn-helix domain-containing protein [Candidatus Bipolaricaulota bacterium]
MLTEDQLQTVIAFGREQRGIEFKGPGTRTDKAFMGKVVRAMLGMANKPGGGFVIIGVTDDGTTLAPAGLSAAELATWNYDDLASSVTNYADPYVDFTIEAVEADGRTYAVVEVREFDELPIICKRSLDPTLREGAMYVRPKGKVETVGCSSHVEMREIVDSAAEKLAKRMLARRSRLGLAEADAADEREKLDREAEELL